MSRIEREKRTVSLMIRIYCRKKEGNKTLCSDCRVLEEYAHKRLSACKYGNLKTSCKKCPTHCYRKEMREKIREVMRFSGPRMILYHPIEAIRHICEK
ncbi:MAG: nitrous oxide-stimulated promoter family protein [Bacteroidales bacterium]|nr:nitrous oxide-stimulated promoter family protein [Bacteroidales bacterium]